MSDERSDDIDPAVIARAALETLVFAPIGLGAMLIEDAPQAVRRVRQELSNARFIGRLTVEQSAARLRSGAARHDEPRGTRETDEAAGGSDGDGLPIAGYDEMPAIEIVSMLGALTPAERDSIAAHESAHRRRRTVLGKIAQLAQ